MDLLYRIVLWFSGGASQYMRLDHCMNHDYFWIAITITLDVTIAAGYVVIARHWWHNERSLPNIPAKTALRSMRNIFAFCGVCGYLFIPIKMVWPAWRLYDIFLAGLAYYTWKYARNTKNLNVVYHELGRSSQLAVDLESSRKESRNKTAFLNALSHDLRTPLNALLLHCEIAQVGLRDNDHQTVNAALEDIKGNSKMTADLLERLLQCAKLDWAAEPDELTVFSLRELLQEAMIAPRASAQTKHLTLELSCTAELNIRSDRQKLERIVVNLLSNAVKFTERGGVTVAVRRADENIEINVVDTGVGMSSEQQAKLFDEFFQANNEERDPRKGFGLGLSIARRLARQLGGDITVASGSGGGSRFSVALPGVIKTEPASKPTSIVTLETAEIEA